MNFFDTIVAPITATGGAIAVVRLSGPDSWALARKVFAALPESPESHHAYYGSLSTGDDGLALPFAQGKSFTGEQSCELSSHGSAASVRLLLEHLSQAGARAARPGEFTERAFLNGNLDLTQAESVKDTVEAITDRQLANANSGRTGALSKAISPVVQLVTRVLATIEASVDFSEEIGPIDLPAAIAALTESHVVLDSLADRAKYGRILRNGIRIAIIGPPNAGKSSLLNALLGHNRAIVTDIAGTTRDYIEETCELGGLPCVLIDTAGLRDSEETIESIGIQLSRTIAANADLVWYVYDASIGVSNEDLQTIQSLERGEPAKPVWILSNKADLPVAKTPTELARSIIRTSALTGSGLQQLSAMISQIVPNLDGYIPNERHLHSLTASSAHLTEAILSLQHGLPPDLVVTHVRSVLHEIGLITGETATDDLLERIFADFCIGK